MSKKIKCFTLIELLVVIAIIGILAGIITLSVLDAKAKGRYARLLSDTSSVARAMKIYEADTGKLPPDVGPWSPTSQAGFEDLANYLPVWPTPICNTWVYDWDKWPNQEWCDSLTPPLPVACQYPPTQRVSIRNYGDPGDTPAKFFFCISSGDPYYLSDDPNSWYSQNGKEPKSGGGIDLTKMTSKKIYCNE